MTDLSTPSRPRPLRDLLVAGSPIVGLGIAGNLIGTLLGGALINPGYVLMIVIGSRLLRRQESGWRELGLQRPASWPKTVLLGIAAFLAAVVVFVAAQLLAAGLLTQLGLPPSEIDQSRFDEIQGNLPFFLLLLVLAWTSIVFGEELYYQGPAHHTPGRLHPHR